MTWQMKVDHWIDSHTFHHSDFADIPRLLDLKQKKELKISLVFPTLNEQDTIGKEIKIIRDELQIRYPLIDEIAVIDSGSTDHTLAIAEQEGARAYLASQILPRFGHVRGKGENLWKSLYVIEGDIILWLDADIKNFNPKFAYGILGPLIEHDDISYVKAFYERPINYGNRLRSSGGGRVTEILVRPLLSNFYPELSGLLQPLSGEYAGRRSVLEELPFRVGYGVEVGLLIDIYERWGLSVLAQVDLDKRVHRNRRLSDLGKMSFAILHTFFTRLQQQEVIAIDKTLSNYFNAVKARGSKLLLAREQFSFVELPPMVSVPEYRKKQGMQKLEQ